MGSFCSYANCKGSIHNECHLLSVKMDEGICQSYFSKNYVHTLISKEQHLLEKKKNINDISQKNEKRKNTIKNISMHSGIQQNGEKNYIIDEKTEIKDELIKKLYEQLPEIKDKVKVEEIRLKFNDGGYYRGEWNPEKHERHGRGIKIWKKTNNIYYGYWVNDKMSGYGKKIYDVSNIDNIDIFTEDKNYLIYEGNWKNSIQDGVGKEHWPDNTEYEGEYKEGKKWGRGRLSSPDFEFEGFFVKDVINGKGIMKYEDGRKYEGEWLNNRMDGEGVFTWPDGRAYKGHYKNDLKDGYGEFSWPNGRKYVGNWTKGKQNDEGKIYYPEKNIWVKGKWKMGIKVKCNI